MRGDRRRRTDAHAGLGRCAGAARMAGNSLALRLDLRRQPGNRLSVLGQRCAARQSYDQTQAERLFQRRYASDGGAIATQPRAAADNEPVRASATKCFKSCQSNIGEFLHINDAIFGNIHTNNGVIQCMNVSS